MQFMDCTLHLQRKSNVNKFDTFRNWMFVLQRITGVIILIFIAWHVWETRIAAALVQMLILR